MTIADVELSIDRRIDGTATVSMRVELPHQRVDPVRGVPVTIDQPALTALTNDPDGYGAALAAMVFPPPLREAWREARGYADGRGEPLRVRLALSGDDALHAIRWELLRDPADSSPLAYSERTRLSRFLPATSYQPLRRVGRPELQAVVAVASPAWLPRELAPLAVAGEVARARRGLAELRTAVVDGQRGRPAATLQAIVGALRDGAHILYLICHGARIAGEPYLYLEREAGEPERPIAAGSLAQAIAQLERRPLLVVLASCRSAGDAYATLTAIGPQLAGGGVGAVIAMQGDVPLELVAELTPRLFAELRRDGQIDRALAAARSALPAGAPWWLPTLWMAVRDGALWHSAAGETAGVPGAGAVHISVGNISGISGQLALGSNITQTSGQAHGHQGAPSSGRLSRLLREGLSPNQLRDLVLTLEDEVGFGVVLAAPEGDPAGQVGELVRLCRAKGALGALVRSVLAAHPHVLGPEQGPWLAWAEAHDRQ